MAAANFHGMPVATAQRSKARTQLRDWLTTGEAIRIRERAGLTQADLARDVGVAASAISRWETGERFPRGQNDLLRYHRALVRLRQHLPIAS